MRCMNILTHNLVAMCVVLLFLQGGVAVAIEKKSTMK